MYFNFFQNTYKRKTKFYLKFQKTFYKNEQVKKRKDLNHHQPKRTNQTKEAEMYEKSWNSNWKNKGWVQEKGHLNQKSALELLQKAKQKWKDAKKWNNHKPTFKSKKEERNRQFLLNEKEEMIEKIWLVLSLSFLISKSKNKFGFEKNIIKCN